MLTTESPNYPSKYPNLAKCEWKITPLPGNRLYFEFSDFDLEHIIDYEYDDDLVTNEPACTDFDFLTIEERDKDVGTMIRSNKYCDHMPNKMNSSNTVVIKLVIMMLIDDDVCEWYTFFMLSLMYAGFNQILVMLVVVFTWNTKYKDAAESYANRKVASAHQIIHHSILKIHAANG